MPAARQPATATAKCRAEAAPQPHHASARGGQRFGARHDVLDVRLTRLHLLVATTLLMHISATGIRFTMLLHAVHLGASSVFIGLLGALAPLLPTFLSLHTGRLIDRRGARGPMLTSLALHIASAALGIMLFSVNWLLGVAVLIGLAHSTWTIAHQQMVGVFSLPGERAAGFSLSALGYAIGSLVAPVLSGLTIEHAGYPATYAWQLGLTLLPLSIIGLRGLRLPPGSRALPPAVQESDAHRPTRPVSMFELLRGKTLREVFIVGTLFEAAWTLFGFLTPIYGAQLGLPSSTVGMVTGSISVTAILVRMILPRLVRHIAPWRLLIGALALMAIGFLCFSLSHSVTLLISFGLLLGVGQAIGAPMVNALLYEQAPAGRGAEAVGLRAMLNNACQTILPLASGALGAALGIAPAFWLLSAALSAGCVKVRRRWNPVQPPASAQR